MILVRNPANRKKKHDISPKPCKLKEKTWFQVETLQTRGKNIECKLKRIHWNIDDWVWLWFRSMIKSEDPWLKNISFQDIFSSEPIQYHFYKVIVILCRRHAITVWLIIAHLKLWIFKIRIRQSTLDSVSNTRKLSQIKNLNRNRSYFLPIFYQMNCPHMSVSKD